MLRRRFRPGSRHCAAPSTLTSIDESPTSTTTNLLSPTLLPPPTSSSSSATRQRKPSTHAHERSSFPFIPQSNSNELLPYSDSDKRILQAKKRSASEAVELELEFFGKVRRIEELKTYLQGIVDAAPEKRGDQLLIDWKEEWIDVLRKSSQTDYTIEVIKRQVRPAEQAVGRGEKLTERRPPRSKRCIKLDYRPRQVHATKMRWQEAEIEYQLSRLVKKFTRYHNQQRMLDPESLSHSEETAQTDRMLNWFQKLKITLFQYLKMDEKTRTRWVGIKLELERLELILQDEQNQALDPTLTPLFAGNNVLARVKLWEFETVCPFLVRSSQVRRRSKIR